jgi:hypothetical protein
MILNKSTILLLPFVLTHDLAVAFTSPQYTSCRGRFPSTSRYIHLYSTSEDCDGGVNGVSPQVAELDNQEANATESPSTATTTDNSQATILKSELVALAERLNRGFQATQTQRGQVKDLIFQLAALNPTSEPASPYYEGISSSYKESNNTLSGKWTLVYTDAPDITGLDTSRNPFSTAQLGRIGQECNPPYIKNVIEWKRPEWAKNLPLSGGDESRVLQKVVTTASGS